MFSLLPAPGQIVLARSMDGLDRILLVKPPLNRFGADGYIAPDRTMVMATQTYPHELRSKLRGSGWRGASRIRRCGAPDVKSTYPAIPHISGLVVG